MTIASVLDLRFSDEKSVRVGFAAALVMLISIAAFTYYSIVRMDESSDLVDRTHELQTRIAEIDALYALTRIRWRSYILNGNPDALADYKAAAAELPSRMDTLQIMITDKQQQSRLQVFRDVVTVYLPAIDESAELKSAGKFKGEVEIIAELKRYRPPVAKATAALMHMADEETRLLAIRERDDKKQAAIARLVLITGTTASVAILLLTFVLLSWQMKHLNNAKQDITALNTQLQKRTDHLEIANQELESFSYSVSHDLRSPLRAIGGYARMLDEDEGPRLDEDGKQHLAVIRSEADRLGVLIDDLLAFSQLGRQELRMATVDITALVRDVIDELRPTAAAATRFEAGPLPATPGDRALLRQVWINLIGNAIKYSCKRDEPVVRISGRINSDMAVYRIEDNGAGFDMRHYNKLFGVFQRLHDIEDFPGTGIGLAMVQRVVARHGGLVWAEGAPDRGAVFYFSLPIEVQNRGPQ